MLEPREQLIFDGMVNHLSAEDPRFVRRIHRIGPPRPRLRMVVAVLLWTMAPVFVVLGGWTGLILAVLAVGYGTHVSARRDATGAPAAWWSGNRRPGASI